MKNMWKLVRLEWEHPPPIELIKNWIKKLESNKFDCPLSGTTILSIEIDNYSPKYHYFQSMNANIDHFLASSDVATDHLSSVDAKLLNCLRIMLKKRF